MRFTVTATDRDEANMLMRSSDLHAALRQYDRWLRDQIKYQGRNELQEAREQLYARMPEGVFE